MFGRRLFFASLASLLATSCTGALNTSDVRKGNYNAPPEFQIAEDCKSADPALECKVVISEVPAKNSLAPQVPSP
jgi:hypothetical protein